MNTKAILAAALIAASAGGAAEGKTWTLQECIDYALENNLTVQQREIEVMQAEQQVTEARDGVLPQLSGSAQQNWNFGRGLTSSNTYADRNTSSLGLNVGLQLPLFQGLQNVRQVQYAKASLSAIVENLESAKDDITLRIIAQYLQVLYCGEIETVAQSQLQLTSEELDKREALLEAGKIPEADMLDARSQAAQARMQLVTAQNDRRLALLDLSQLLRLNDTTDFDIAPAGDGSTPVIPLPQAVFDTARGHNHSLQAQRLQIQAADRQIKLARTGYIPRLSFNAGLGSNYYTVSGIRNEAFGAQMRHNFSQYVGFSLSVPIFDGFATRNNVRRAKLGRLNADLQYETALDQLYKQINQAYYQAEGARERLAAAKAAVEATEATLDAVREKYNIGRATPTDFDTARNQHVKAMSERVQAKYELELRVRILDFYARPMR